MRADGLTVALATTAALLASSGCGWTGARAGRIFVDEVTRDGLAAERGAPDYDRILHDTRSLHATELYEKQMESIRSADEITLADAFRLAVLGSESLKIRSERVFSVEMQQRESIAAVLPKVVALGEYRKDSGVVSFGGDQFTPAERTSYYLQVQQPVLDGEFFPVRAILKQTHRIETLELRDARDQLMFAVASEFYEILSLQRDLQAFEASLASSEEHLRVLRARLDVGEADQQEVLLATARRDEAESQMIRTREDIGAARARLEELVGASPLPTKLVDSYEVDAPATGTPQLLDRAMKQRLEMEIARRQVDVARAQRNRTAAEYQPKVDLTYTDWTHVEGGFNSRIDWTLGLDLEWTLFDSGGREARMAEAFSTIRQRNLELRRLEKQMQREVKEAVHAYRALDLAMQAFESRADAATAAHEQAKARFLAGELTNLDVLESLQTREEAVRDMERAKLARRLAVLRIRLSVGDLAGTEPARRALLVRS